MLTLDRRHVIAAAGLPLLGAAPAPAPLPEDMTLGNPKAKVKVVEYASAACSHCAAFALEVFPAFRKKYIDTGRVHYTLKEFLTEPVQLAVSGFLLARCSGKARYFGTLDAVFRAHPAIFAARNLMPLAAVGQGVGLNEAALNACITDKASVDALMARAQRHHEADGIHATPTFVVNGRTVKEGPMTLAELDAAIAEAAKAR